MLFDFDTFADVLESVFPQENTVYTMGECLMVFREYFRQYEEKTGRAHPNISARQIVKICEIMPWYSADDAGSYQPSITAETYREVIRKHFRTRYRNCDYNINHFFSGHIRERRYQELRRS